MNTDIVTRMGHPRAGAHPEVQLIEESVGAVCSPSFLARHAQIASAHDLLSVPLLCLSGPPTSSWYDWDSWFDILGISGRPAAEKTNFNTYDIIMRGAQDGMGVALGWHGLIDAFLARGELVSAVPEVAKSRRGYFIHLSQENPTSAAKRVYEWILSETIG